MSLAKTTAPLSGYEHVISHVLGMTAEAQGRPLAAHGSQVALAVLLSAESYRRLLDAFDPRAIDPAQVIPPKEAVRASVWEAFGPLDRVGKTASECWADVEAKLDAWGAAVEHWSEMLARWDDVRSGIRTLLRPPEFLASILRAVDAPLRFADLDPPITASQVRAAFLSAPLIRRRYTIGDAPHFFGWDRARLWREGWGHCQRLVETDRG